MPDIIGTPKLLDKSFSIYNILKEYQFRGTYDNYNKKYTIIKPVTPDYTWFEQLTRRSYKSHGLIIGTIRLESEDDKSVISVSCYGYPKSCYNIACEIESQLGRKIQFIIADDTPFDA